MQNTPDEGLPVKKQWQCPEIFILDRNPIYGGQVSNPHEKSIQVTHHHTPANNYGSDKGVKSYRIENYLS